MYVEAGLMFPYFVSLSQEAQQLEEFLPIEKTNASSNIGSNSTLFEYDFGGEGDLFKAPAPIVEEEPLLELDPMTAAISMISNGDDLLSTETINATYIESVQNDHLFNEVFIECKIDLLANSPIEESHPTCLDVVAPALRAEGPLIEEKEPIFSFVPIQKSVSSESLSSMDWINGAHATRPSFLDFQNVDLATLSMRRAYSEGDIQTLSNRNNGLIYSSFERLPTIGNYSIEERRERLSRYRHKKSKRNFSRKIKYACRKALAESQPRVRGRFAKNGEAVVSSLK